MNASIIRRVGRVVLGASVALALGVGVGFVHHRLGATAGDDATAMGRTAAVETVGELHPVPAMPGGEPAQRGVASRPPVAPRSARLARDISAMTCTGWQELQAGSGHVRVCS